MFIYLRLPAAAAVAAVGEGGGREAGGREGSPQALGARQLVLGGGVSGR